MDIVGRFSCGGAVHNYHHGSESWQLYRTDKFRHLHTSPSTSVLMVRVLNVAEKPAVARRLAEILGRGRAAKVRTVGC